MAYIQVPTRTTNDPNASSDINQLQDNVDALLDGSKVFTTLNATTVSIYGPLTVSGITTTTNLSTNTISGTDAILTNINSNAIIATAGTFDNISTNTLTATYGSIGNVYTKTEVDTSFTNRPFTIDLQAGTWIAHPNTAPEHEELVGASGIVSVDWFDDTTEEFLLAQIQMPTNIAVSGNVEFEAVGFAKAADGNRVALKLYHSPGSLDNSWDQAFGSAVSDDYVTSSTQDDYDYITWSEGISTLAWGTDNLVRLKMSRTVISSGSPVVGDYGVNHLRIKIPRSD
jgi:hypothetical protein